MKQFSDLLNGDMTGETYDYNLRCSGMYIDSLKGAPSSVGVFSCGYNNLKTLEFSPRIVKGNFECAHNELVTLEGGPEEVHGDYDCSDNKLTNLKGLAKKISGKFFAHNNTNPFLDDEYKLRIDNPTMSDDEIFNEMFKITKYDGYMPQSIKDVFIF